MHEAPRRRTPMGDAQMYIDGKWLDAAEGKRFDVMDPATGETFATVPDAQPEDAEAAIDAARRAFDEGPWSRSTERERETILLKAAEIVRREHRRLSELESQDSGKPIGEAEEDIAEVGFMVEYY